MEKSYWNPEACNVLSLKHYLHSSFEKSLMERVNQYFNDRTKGFHEAFLLSMYAK